MVRRAMSKKKVKDIEKERGAFIRGDASRNITGCVANGIPEQTARRMIAQGFLKHALDQFSDETLRAAVEEIVLS